MLRSRSIPSLLAVLALILNLPSHASNVPPWLELHSAHFTVITDAGEKKGREVAFRFEQMRAVFANLLGKDRLNQSIPLTILALRNDSSYFQVAPLHDGQPTDAPGFFLGGQDQDFIVLNTSADEPWRAVAHDFALMLLTYNYPPTQAWFDEGLAEYFSSIRLDNRQVQIGGDPELSPSATQDLVGNQRDLHPAKSLTELLGGQTWLSLTDLFTMKHDPSLRNEGSHHTLYYAESWIVMHYLLHEKKLPETGTYFGLVLNQNVPVEEAIQKAYGMSSAQLERAIKEYLHSQTGLADAVEAARQTTSTSNGGSSAGINRFSTLVAPDDSAITSKAIADGDARALYATIQTRIPERREAGLNALQQLASTPTAADQKAEAKHEVKRMGEDPEQLPSNAIGNPVAHRLLAWDHIQHDKFDEAFAELKDAAALNPDDMWIRYYVSVAKYRFAQARHADIPGLSNMMLDLKSVLEWYPEMADAYDLLAVARNTGGGASAALEAERAAIGLSPRDERYRLHLAQIYVAGKNWDAANNLLAHLKLSSDPQIVARANDLLEQAGAERRYGIRVDANGTPQPRYAPQKSPFDVLEEDAAKRATAENPTDNPADKRSTKYAKGRLVDVDCSKAPAAVLTVTSETGTLKLHAADYKSILVIGADDFSCEWHDRQVTVNYKPRAGVEGDLVSLEVR
jgi:tetratricopeptide (TPR) repeat protein